MMNKYDKDKILLILVVKIIFVAAVIGCSSLDSLTDSGKKPKFVAMPGDWDNNKIAYSYDGINWKSATMPSKAYWGRICYGNGKFVALSYRNDKAAYSFNGISWKPTKLPSYENWESVCYGNNKFVAKASNGKIAYSDDGIDWKEATLSNEFGAGNICYCNGKFIATGSRDEAAYSEDGINWIKTKMPASGKWQIFYGNSKFIAIDYDRAAYSDDGIKWIKTKMPSSGNWRICYGNGKFVAIVYDSYIAAYSDDGIKWIETLMPSVIPYDYELYQKAIEKGIKTGRIPAIEKWTDVSYGNGRFVAIANNENTGWFDWWKFEYNKNRTSKISAAYSDDGINWKASKLPHEANWESICFGGE